MRRVSIYITRQMVVRVWQDRARRGTRRRRRFAEGDRVEVDITGDGVFRLDEGYTRLPCDAYKVCVTRGEFVIAWQTSGTREEVACKLGVRVYRVISWERKLRRQGTYLKSMGPVRDLEFEAVWAASASRLEVAVSLGLSLQQVRCRGRFLRDEGVDLKAMPAADRIVINRCRQVKSMDLSDLNHPYLATLLDNDPDHLSGGVCEFGRGNVVRVLGYGHHHLDGRDRFVLPGNHWISLERGDWSLPSEVEA